MFTRGGTAIFLDREQVLKENALSLEQDRELERYMKENDVIDAYKIKKGIMPELIIHGGEYATLYLHPEFETKWKGTFFDTMRCALSTKLRDKHSLAKYHYFERIGRNRRYTFWILGYCDMAVACEEGVRIHLIDPNGEVWLPPFGVPKYMAMVYSGKMLVTQISFSPEGIEIIEAGTMPYTLTEEITEDHPLYDTLTDGFDEYLADPPEDGDGYED